MLIGSVPIANVIASPKESSNLGDMSTVLSFDSILANLMLSKEQSTDRERIEESNVDVSMLLALQNLPPQTLFMLLEDPQKLNMSQLIDVIGAIADTNTADNLLDSPGFKQLMEQIHHLLGNMKMDHQKSTQLDMTLFEDTSMPFTKILKDLMNVVKDNPENDSLQRLMKQAKDIFLPVVSEIQQRVVQKLVNEGINIQSLTDTSVLIRTSKNTTAQAKGPVVMTPIVHVYTVESVKILPERESTNIVDAADIQVAVPTHTASLTDKALISDKAFVQTAPLYTPEQLPKFTSDMLVKSFQLTANNGVSEAQITLNPESLGKVDIKLSIENGQVAASLVASTVVGKEALEGQLNQLRLSLQTLGLQVDKIVVTQSTPQYEGSLPQRQNQSNNQQSKQERHTSQSDTNDGTIVATESFEMKLMKSSYIGSFNATV